MKLESSEASNNQRVAVINPNNINFALTGSLITPLTDETGAPSNSLIDKRHTMFAQDIKKYINDANGRIHGGGGTHHQRHGSQQPQSSNPVKPSGQQIKIASMPLANDGKAVSMTRTGGRGEPVGPDVQDLVAR